MAKRAAASRAFVHILRPNKTKPVGPIKRARKTAKRTARGLGNAGRHKTRTVIKLTAKAPFKIGAAAGRGAVKGTSALPPRTRRTVVLRQAGGRFNGSRRA
jgi:hypothetical protein